MFKTMKQFGFLGLLVFLLAAFNLPSAFSAETANKKPKVDLPNFHQVHPYLYRGGEPTNRGLAKLKAMGIQTVIDLRGKNESQESEDKEVKSLGMSYINLPMSDKAPTDNQVTTFLSEVGKASTNQAGPVFVHCAHGSDRTGCMVGIWRVSHDNFTYDEAYKEMRKYYFGPKYVNLAQTVKQRVKQ